MKHRSAGIASYQAPSKGLFVTFVASLAIAACGGDDGAPADHDASVDAAVDATVDAAPDAAPPPPTLSIAAPTLTEGNGGVTAGTVQVTLSAASATPITVNFDSTDGTATAAIDFTDLSGTLTFAPGTTMMPIAVEVTGDTLDEDDEAFTVTLSSPTGATLATATATVTIADDDAAPTIAVAPITAAEGAVGGLPFAVTLSTASGKPITVSYATTDGTATAADYAAATGMLTFMPGETARTVAVALANDALDEANETLQLGLSAPVNATIMVAAATGTITDDDPTPSLSIDDAAVTEGNAATSMLSFPVTLSAASGRAVSVNYATTAGTATAGTDYVTATGTLVIPAGATTGMIDVTVNGDALAEPDETFTVTLSAPVDATITAPPTTTGTVLNDDGALPGLSIGDVAIAEGNAGTTSLTFTVTLAAAAAANVTVAYATANVTATDAPGVGGTDYVPTAGTLTFAPGVLTRPVTVQVVGDVNDEANETFRVNLSAPTNATIADPFGVGTITDDDATPTLSTAAVTVGESTATTAFTVALSAAAGRNLTVNYATADGTAIAGGTAGAGGQDYVARSGTLTYLPGETSKTVAISINADALDEPDQTFAFTMAGAVNATITTPTVNATITDDDATPTVAIADLAKVEGTGGASVAAVPVTLSAASGRTVTVNFTTGPAPAPSATPGTDYTMTSGTLTFAPGVTTATANVTLTPDAIDEAFERFVVDLSGPVNATVADGQGLVTIVNDDSPLPNVSIGNAANVTEAAASNTMTFTVTLSSVAAAAVTVDYATSAAGTATAGADYTATAGTLTFAPGQTSKTIAVPILVDLLDEAAETVFVNLGGASANANLLDAQGQGTILDNDPTPTLSIADVAIAEGNAGVTNAVVTATLSAASGQTVTVNYTTIDASASSATGLGLDDFEARSGTLTFPPGTLTRTILVPINGDGILEPNDAFNIGLAAPTNVTIATPIATVTITNDDAQPTLAIIGMQMFEGPLGLQTPLTFRITMSAVALAPVTVVFNTANGTATTGIDFIGQANVTLTLVPGATVTSRNVFVLGDPTVEANETFTGALSNAIGATIMTANGTATIVNDD